MTHKKYIKSLKNKVISELTQNNISINEARIETELLIEHVFCVKNKDLIINPDIEIPENKLKEFNSLIKKRLEEKIPVQYLINKAYFMGEEFYVDKNVLIPRSETEILVEEVVGCAMRTNSSLKIIDIGTGSGCIAIMLAKKLPNAEITASDISENAIKVAKFNAKNLKIKFVISDIFQNIEEKFDIIVSNPPYISIKEKENLQIEVKKHEPPLALFVDDEKGVSFYEKLAHQATYHLNKPGFLAVEIGFSQAETVKSIFEKAGFKHIKIVKDLSGIERVVIGQLS